MDEKKFQLAEKLRTYISCYGINDFSEERLKKAGLTSAELENNFSKREEIVELILTHERACFEKIFNEYNFDGWNAIDILLLVSNEINERFRICSIYVFNNKRNEKFTIFNHFFI